MLRPVIAIAVSLTALVGCKPAAPAPAPAPVVDAGSTLGTATPRPKSNEPEVPACERHAKTLAAAAAQKGDPHAPVDPLLRGAFNAYQNQYRLPCSPEADWGVVKDSVAMLDDARVLYDHTASEMRRVLMQDAAVVVLERMTGLSQGSYEPPKIDLKGPELDKRTKANAAVRDAWKKWWTTAQNNRDQVFAAAKQKTGEQMAALEQSKLAKLMVSTLSVLHAWDVIPWTGEGLTPNDVIKKEGFVPEMLQPPVHPALVEEVKWGWYLKNAKDGLIYRVIRREEENHKDWRLDAYKQELTQTPEDTRKIVQWPLTDKLPLATLKPNQPIGVPPAFVEWLRKDPAVYFTVLETGSFGATVIEGNRVYLLALRQGELGM